MAKSRKLTKQWTDSEEKTLGKLIRAGEPTTRIARKLRRSPASIRSKAQKWGLSLKRARSRR